MSKYRKRKGHVAKTEYSKSGLGKVVAVGRRKQCGHSYVCPCCVTLGLNHFKVASRRILRRTYRVPDEDAA
jgi:hypothetical protein